MTSVLDFPVAEQYPSSTDTSGVGSSKRISHISSTLPLRRKKNPGSARGERAARLQSPRHYGWEWRGGRSLGDGGRSCCDVFRFGPGGLPLVSRFLEGFPEVRIVKEDVRGDLLACDPVGYPLRGEAVPFGYG